MLGTQHETYCQNMGELTNLTSDTLEARRETMDNASVLGTPAYPCDCTEECPWNSGDALSDLLYFRSLEAGIA